MTGPIQKARRPTMVKKPKNSALWPGGAKRPTMVRLTDCTPAMAMPAAAPISKKPVCDWLREQPNHHADHGEQRRDERRFAADAIDQQTEADRRR
jgi:hypothetical protein